MESKSVSFKKISDFSNCREITRGLEEVSLHYCGLRRSAVECGLAGLDHGEAKEILWPMAHYLQRRATPEQRDEIAGHIVKNCPELIYLVSEGILHTFVAECKSLKITNSMYLLLMKAVHAILMELSSYMDMQIVLIKSGAVSLLFKELKLFSRSYHIDVESDKFVVQLIQSNSVTISNCIQNYCDAYMRLQPDVDIDGVLLPYTRHHDPVVRTLLSFTRIQFATYLHLADPGSVDRPMEEITGYVALLLQGVKRKDLVAISQGIQYELTDIITTLRSLSVAQNNRHTLFSNVQFPLAISSLMCCGNPAVVLSTLDLILALVSPLFETVGSKLESRTVHVPDYENGILAKRSFLSCVPDIVEIVASSGVMKNSDVNVVTLAQATHWILTRPFKNTGPGIDLVSCLKYIKVLHHRKHYLLALLWSEIALEEITGISEEKHLLTLYKAFSLFQIYQIEQVVLMRMENQLDSSKLVRLRQAVYVKAKQVANNIAWIKEKAVIVLPDDAIELLDISLMDVVREVNLKFESKSGGAKHPDAKLRCLLCHKHESLVKGHFWPHSTYKGASSTKVAYLVNSPSEMHKKSEYKTSKGVVFYMFCRRCDNTTLSVEENYFAESIMKKISKSEEQEIVYNNSLYRFCITMAFRALIFQRGLQKCTNFKKIYKIFLQCRNLLMNAENFDINCSPQIAIFFTPVALVDEANEMGVKNDDQSVGESLESSIGSAELVASDGALPLQEVDKESPSLADDTIIKYLTRNGFAKLSYVPILESEPTVSRKGHFLVVHWDVFSIVLMLERVDLPKEYHSFLIQPNGGTLIVPANDKRLILTPLGLRMLYRKITISCSNFLLSAPPKSIPKSISLDENPVPLIGDVNQPSFVNLLPAGMIINRYNSTITLPTAHSVLLHDTVHDVVSSCGVTVLLAVDEVMKPYAIIHYTNPNGAVSLGFYVDSDEFLFKELLPDKKPKQVMQHVASGYNRTYQFFKDLPSLLLPNALSHAGVTRFEDLLLHNHSGSGVTLDRKCVQPLMGGGCWYCEFNCEVCMKPFTPSFLIHTDDGDATTFKFCGKECQDLFSHHPLVIALLSESAKPPPIGVSVVSEHCTVTESKTPNINQLASKEVQQSSTVFNVHAVFLSDENIPMQLNLHLYTSEMSSDVRPQKHVVFLLRSATYQFAGSYPVSEKLNFVKDDAFEYFGAVQRILHENAGKLVHTSASHA